MKLLRPIPEGAPIKDGCAWFLIVGASDSAYLRGYSVLPGNMVDVACTDNEPRTPWVTIERARQLLQAIADGKDIELLC